MNYLIHILSLTVLTVQAHAQNINFTDSELKRHLIEQPCAVLIPGGSAFENPDVNGDGEIQISEAQNIHKLFLQDLIPSEYYISSLDDLAALPNLMDLHIYSLDSLIEINQPNLSSLKALHIDDCLFLKYVDISNLTGLTDKLYIIGIVNLAYLNIQNGSVANDFSLFYTIETEFACVDSIAAEFDAFYNFGSMQSGVLPSISCSASSTDKLSQVEIEIYPNPFNNEITVNTDEPIIALNVYNIQGQKITTITEPNTSIDLSPLEAGFYLFEIQTNSHELQKLMIKE